MEYVITTKGAGISCAAEPGIRVVSWMGLAAARCAARRRAPTLDGVGERRYADIQSTTGLWKTLLG